MLPKTNLNENNVYVLTALRAPHVFSSPEYISVVERAVDFFARTPVHNLPPPRGITGVGVYAIYYTGNFAPYAALGKANVPDPTIPIYIGKAVPEGSRTGRNIDAGTKTVVGRLAEHARSIAAAEKYAASIGAENVRLADFRSRFVIFENLEIDLIATLESALIRKYRPLWNNVVDGFGNHDPGAGRRAQSRSEWDTLHPGRAFAALLTGVPPTLAAVETKVQAAMSQVVAQPMPTEAAVEAVAEEHEQAAEAVPEE